MQLQYALYIMRIVISNHKTRLRCSVRYTRNSRNVRNFLHFAVSCFRRDSLITENTKQKFRWVLYRVVGTRFVLVVSWKKKFCHRRLQKKNLLASAHSFVEFKERKYYSYGKSLSMFYDYDRDQKMLLREIRRMNNWDGC